MEWVATAQAPCGQPAATTGAVHPDRLERIRAARRIEPAARRHQRADELPVAPDQADKQPRRNGRSPDRIRAAATLLSHTAPPCRRSSARITKPSSVAKSAWLAVAAGGLARNTRRLPPGSACRYPATRWRSLRRTLFRTTAGPTARLTMNPIRGCSSTPRRISRWPTRSGRPDLLPPRIAAVNSWRRRIRATDGSTGHHRRTERSAVIRR